MTDYISHLEFGVVGSLPIAEVASTTEIVTLEIALSQAISLKRIADSLAALTEVAINPVVTAIQNAPPGFFKPNDEPKADDNPWIEWPGGECPVPPDSAVYVRFRLDGPETEAYLTVADNLRWDHRPSDSDIIAYRVVKP